MVINVEHIIESDSVEFKDRIECFLVNIKKENIINISYRTSVSTKNEIVYSALIIYETN